MTLVDKLSATLFIVLWLALFVGGMLYFHVDRMRLKALQIQKHLLFALQDWVECVSGIAKSHNDANLLQTTEAFLHTRNGNKKLSWVNEMAINLSPIDLSLLELERLHALEDDLMILESEYNCLVLKLKTNLSNPIWDWVTRIFHVRIPTECHVCNRG